MPGQAECTLTRAIAFHATHQYSEGGPVMPHGHLYRIEVSVRRNLGPAESAVIDLGLLDHILTEEVAEPLAGRHVNDAPGIPGQPTCEVIAIWCWQRIAPRLPASVQLQRVRVAEDGTLWADCTGVS